MLLHTKEIFWKFAFRYFFPLERGLTTGRWPRTALLGAISPHAPSPGSTLLNQTLGCPPAMDKTSRRWPRTPWPNPCAKAYVLHDVMWPVLSCFLETWLRMTLTSHSTKEKWSLSWICFVLGFKSPFTVTRPKNFFKNLCIFYCLPICPLCFNVNPKSDKPVNQWSWSFGIIHGCFEGKGVLNSLMAQIREWMGFALHLIKRRKVSEGILWSYWSLWKQKPNPPPSLSVFLMLYTVNLLDWVLGFCLIGQRISVLLLLLNVKNK